MPEILEQLRTALVGRYAIERELGRGGYSVVYLAHDVKHDRKVALKVLQPELALAVRHERFRREIQIAAKLSHPHILPLYDSGEVNGTVYYVMPYVDGESLRDQKKKRVHLEVLRRPFHQPPTRQPAGSPRGAPRHRNSSAGSPAMHSRRRLPRAGHKARDVRRDSY